VYANLVAKASSPTFLVVSGLLPLQVAESRTRALAAMGFPFHLTVVSHTPLRGFVYYGGFRVKQAALDLARRIRGIGYTALVVTE
jgi:hypothetical protein